MQQQVKGIMVVPHEESFLVPVSKTFRARGGFNSEVLYIRNYDSGARKIEKRVGAKRGGFAPEQAMEIAKDIAAYQEELAALGVPIPALDDEADIKFNLRSQQAFILLTSDYTGHDLERIINLGGSEPDLAIIRPLTVSMCAILKKVCAVRISSWETKTGIDPKCSNFTLDETGRVWYVDPFPPRYRKQGVPVIEWQESATELGRQLGYFKYYDVRGIILGLTAQLARVQPGLKPFFEQVVLEEFQEVVPYEQYQVFLRDLNSAPWVRLRGVIGKHATATDLVFGKEIIRRSLARPLFGIDYHVYTLREIALELSYANRMSAGDLEDFFKASHFEDELPEAKLQELQEMLCSFL